MTSIGFLKRVGQTLVTNQADCSENNHIYRWSDDGVGWCELVCIHCDHTVREREKHLNKVNAYYYSVVYLRNRAYFKDAFDKDIHKDVFQRRYKVGKYAGVKQE